MALIGQQLLSRHDELKERARQLLEATKREAREKERNRLQKAKEEASPEANGGLKNGETSPSKKVCSQFVTLALAKVIYKEQVSKFIVCGVISNFWPYVPNIGQS